MGQGHRTIAGRGENPDQMFEVGAVVLGEAMRSHNGGLAPARLAVALAQP